MFRTCVIESNFLKICSGDLCSPSSLLKISTSIIIWRRKWDCDHPIANQSNYRDELHSSVPGVMAEKFFIAAEHEICYSNSLTQVLHWLNGCCEKNSNEAFFLALVRNGKSIAIYIVALTLMLRTGSFEHCECSCKSRRSRLFDSLSSFEQRKSNDAKVYFKSDSTLRIEVACWNILSPTSSGGKWKQIEAKQNLKLHKVAFAFRIAYFTNRLIFERKKLRVWKLVKSFLTKGASVCIAILFEGRRRIGFNERLRVSVQIFPSKKKSSDGLFNKDSWRIIFLQRFHAKQRDVKTQALPLIHC